MIDFAATLKEVLQGNKKNIADLINQDLTSLLFANLLLENPDLEEEINSLFEKLYRDTSQNLLELLSDFALRQHLSLSPQEEETLKAETQKFVWELVQEKQRQVFEQMHWLSKFKSKP